MPAQWGTVTHPVRTRYDIAVNYPDGFMTEPPGDDWWIGLHSDWVSAMPPSVTRATSVIVNPLVRMPWQVRQPDGTLLDPIDPGYPAWLRDPMLLNGSTGGPNAGEFPMLDRIDAFDLWARWLRDALWQGRGLLRYIPDANGQPLAGSVHRLPPSRLGKNSENNWVFNVEGSAFDDGTGLREVHTDGRIDGTPWYLLLLRHSLPGGVFGVHRAQLALTNRMGTYASEAFDTAIPSGVLSTDQPINQFQADAARDEWDRTHSQRPRRIAVLGNGAKYQPVVLSPVDAELVAMARLSNEQVAHMFELAAWHLDASTNSMTYSNAQDNRQDLVDGPLASWSARLEETLGALLPWGWGLHIDFTAYTMPTTQSQEAPGGSSAAA